MWCNAAMQKWTRFTKFSQKNKASFWKLLQDFLFKNSSNIFSKANETETSLCWVILRWALWCNMYVYGSEKRSQRSNNDLLISQKPKSHPWIIKIAFTWKYTKLYKQQRLIRVGWGKMGQNSPIFNFEKIFYIQQTPW